MTLRVVLSRPKTRLPQPEAGTGQVGFPEGFPIGRREVEFPHTQNSRVETWGNIPCSQGQRKCQALKNLTITRQALAFRVRRVYIAAPGRSESVARALLGHCANQSHPFIISKPSGGPVTIIREPVYAGRQGVDFVSLAWPFWRERPLGGELNNGLYADRSSWNINQELRTKLLFNGSLAVRCCPGRGRHRES